MGLTYHAALCLGGRIQGVADDGVSDGLLVQK